jgi:F0F1-type ATP synthase assembly protein I
MPCLPVFCAFNMLDHYNLFYNVVLCRFGCSFAALAPSLAGAPWDELQGGTSAIVGFEDIQVPFCTVAVFICLP